MAGLNRRAGYITTNQSTFLHPPKEKIVLEMVEKVAHLNRPRS